MACRKLGDIACLRAASFVVRIGSCWLVSGSRMIGVAPKILIRRSLSFFVTRSGRVVGHWPSLINRRRGSRRSRWHRGTTLGGGSFAWFKDKMRIFNAIL